VRPKEIGACSKISKNLSDLPRNTVLGLDIAGVVVDAGTSSKYHAGDRILGPGIIGWSDGSSYQTHVLVKEPHLSEVRNRPPVFYCFIIKG
jgi:NADPH:quinone reductase-like Zn-dependent oxidoreductase